MRNNKNIFQSPSTFYALFREKWLGGNFAICMPTPNMYFFSQKSAEPDRRPRGTRYPTRRMLIDLGRKVRRFLAIRARKRRKKEREAINYGSKNEQPFKETSNGTKNTRGIATKRKTGCCQAKAIFLSAVYLSQFPQSKRSIHQACYI